MNPRINQSPTELYLFSQGVNVWRYTNGLTEINFNGGIFKPSTIERNNVSQSTDIAKNGIKLKFPLTNKFAQQFINFTPDDVTTVTVFRGEFRRDVGSNNFSVFWRGRVLSAKVNNAVITIECESIFTSVRRPGLRARYELQCRHALYSQNCGVNQSGYKESTKVFNVKNGYILQTDGISKDNGWFSGGMVQTQDGVLRYIAEHKDNEIILNRPFNDNIAGQTVALYPGCDHLKETCKNKFNNLDNFGGFPYIPIKNPFNSGSIA
ncbi:MAG: phage BR0599 family protein [Gammaproteobacteria bacterium]|nr:phage BR0599 family protein [Gammaproteobacteria bacterium]